MALWEYKVITSGPHGFASPALLETHLNTLGKDEWEIIHFQTLPNNSLAFHGLARRSTMRDWAPPPEVAASAAPPRPSIHEASSAAKPADKAEEKLEPPTSTAEPVKAADSSLRTFRDTDRDQDPEAQDEEDWDNWEQNEDELPTFFEAIKPLLRKNQKGPGQSVALDHLARRWELKESDVVGALKECGLTVPETEEQDPEYFEFEGDLYWVNRGNRGQLFLNCREKPRPVFRTVAATKLSPEDPAAAELVAERAVEKAELEKQKSERAARQAAADAQREAARAAREKRENEQAAARAARAEAGGGGEGSGHGGARETDAAPADDTLPPGAEILGEIRPHLRRNRRGSGHSGSISFLARALGKKDEELAAAFAALGLAAPENGNEKPAFVEIGRTLYWLNKDGRGGVWINSRPKRDGETVRAESNGEETPTAVPVREGALEPAAVGPHGALPALESAGAAALAASTEVADETPMEKPQTDSVLTAVRLLLKANKRGSGVSGEIGFLARTLEKSEDALLIALTEAGLVTPPDSETKPTFVEHAGEIFWLNKNSTDGSLWLNAKAAKSAAKKISSGTSSRPRSRKPKAAE
jgi:hypothetical protein